MVYLITNFYFSHLLPYSAFQIPSIHPTCSKKGYIRLLKAEFSLILPEVILQEFFVFSLSMFWKGCVLKAADHSSWVDSFRWTQKPGCAVRPVGKLKQCSSVNRLCLPILAATAPQTVHRQYATVYSPQALSTPAHSFQICHLSFLLLPNSYSHWPGPYDISFFSSLWGPWSF